MVTTDPDIFETTAYLLLDLPTNPKIIPPTIITNNHFYQLIIISNVTTQPNIT